jgi:chemosensory pili system protein ChpB (putative protein-glutamate methylesterase)
MIEQVTVRVAVVADTSLQRHILQQFLSKHGYQVVLNSDPQQLTVECLKADQADLWLYDAACANEVDCPVLEYFLTESSAPVLFGEGVAPERSSDDYPRWERSLLKKILQSTQHLAQHDGLDVSVIDKRVRLTPVSIELPQHFVTRPIQTEQPAKQVWLLAASMGGPQAVKAFLDALPRGLPLGFIYAQHIDAHFESSLPQAVGRHSQWSVRLLNEHHFVHEGEVVIVPIQQELRFASNNRLLALDTPWDGPYSPSIEQMMRNLAQHYGHNCGVIVFSGMGNDGSVAAAYVQQHGAQVWTQSAASCTCSSMPDSVAQAGYSVLSASPQDLANALVQYCLNKSVQNNDDIKRTRP